MKKKRRKNPFSQETCCRENVSLLQCVSGGNAKVRGSSVAIKSAVKSDAYLLRSVIKKRH